MDAVLQGVIKDDTILDKEEMTHTTMEKYGHQQCQKAMTEMGLTQEDIDDNLKVDHNSRYGWVPHTLLFKWLQGLWGEAFTSEMFWNMMLHTKNEKQMH
eukprot:6077465-Heterocapsa_arctica.AAC.1